MKNTPVMNPRQLAIAALSDVLDRRLNLNDSQVLQDQARSRDLSLSRHLTYGVLRWLTALDWLASQMLSKPIKQRDRDIHRLILMGLFQLWQDNTAEHAVIDETAECGRRQGKPWAVGMINAVLRRFQRERGLWLGLLAEQPEQYAHPQWLLEKLQKDWPKDWQDLVRANNQQAPLWLRLNRLGPERQVLIDQLEDQGFAVTGHTTVRDAVRITPAAHVDNLTGFAAGHFSVQDPAAQLAAELLDVHAGMFVLDACAAPGGKTCHLLERTPDARVTAVDFDARRIDLIRENLSRLRLNATLITGDAAQPETWWDGVPFQRILLDAPCSAIGVIRRHPEIKHLRQAEQVHTAAQLQQRLLRQLWPLLEPGGILVYATCSVLHDENSGQINNFLAHQDDAGHRPIDALWGRSQTAGRQIFPGEQDMDGFYYAILYKKP